MENKAFTPDDLDDGTLKDVPDDLDDGTLKDVPEVTIEDARDKPGNQYETIGGPDEAVQKQDDGEIPEKTKEELAKEEEVKVEILDTEPATKPYAGMGKEDLLRFSQTPFWNRLRMCFVIFFGCLWLGLLIAVVVLTVIFPRCNPAPARDWWQTSVMYQVYVRSFYDSDGDGIGDINGLKSKLHHLEDLHADTLVLSSVFKSHQEGDGYRDFGYDVIDYNAIDPAYGTMADFENLIAEAHHRDIKIIMEFVPNHTGDKHPWFIGSQESTTHKYANYYIWESCRPNNWRSVYGGSAWTPGPGARSECYLHHFMQHQPELNLRSTAVAEELEEILRFWLDKGVDGFRVNSVNFLVEDTEFRDEPEIECAGDATMDYDCLDHTRTTAQSGNYDLVTKWRNILEEYSDKTGQYRILLTDAHDKINETVRYYGSYSQKAANLPVNYELTKLNRSCGGRCVHHLVDSWLYNMPKDATADWLTGFQDGPRLVSALGEEFASAILMLQMMLPGTALTYYGQEIGMVNGNRTNSSVDPPGQLDPKFSRDPYRSPMQWDGAEFAGFINLTAREEGGNSSTPWLPINDDYVDRNVEAQRGGDNSIMSVYKELANLHRTDTGLHYGHIHYAIINAHIYSFVREFDGTNRFLVSINFGNKTETSDFDRAHHLVPKNAEVAVTTHANMAWEVGDNANLREVTLAPGQGAVFAWEYER